METKDWIIILLPIVVNGILLFIFQLLTKEHIRQNERKKLFKNELLSNLYEKIQDLETGEFYYRSSDAFTLPSKDRIDRENKLMDDLIIYYRGNYFEFRKYEKYIDALDDLWKESISIWYELQNIYPEIQVDLETKNAVKREHAVILTNYYKTIFDWQRCADTIKMLITKNIK